MSERKTLAESSEEFEAALRQVWTVLLTAIGESRLMTAVMKWTLRVDSRLPALGRFSDAMPEWTRFGSPAFLRLVVAWWFAMLALSVFMVLTGR